MTHAYIPRSLKVGEEKISESRFLQSGRVLVVLAEPGAGKSWLLGSLATSLGTKPVRASVFEHREDHRSDGSLVIDAMDEVARLDKAGTNKVIGLAAQAGATSVVFAGRSSEWDRSRTLLVKECFSVEPIIAYLEPFSIEEQSCLFLSIFPSERFEEFRAEVDRLELSALLGNPQFLQLLAEGYIQGGRVFTSKEKIYSDSVNRLARETNDGILLKQPRPATEKIVAAAGELFAKLLLCGASGISTLEHPDDVDYPYLGLALSNEALAWSLLDTRLMRPAGEVRLHEPVHRIVAEYCAAKHLVLRIENGADPLSANRVLAIVAPNSVVRDELRGTLGWMAALAQNELAKTCISLDPYAVIANGDPGRLSISAKTHLLEKLRDAAEIDPYFRRSDVWRRFNVGSFFEEKLAPIVKSLLSIPGSFRDLILELLKKSQVADFLKKEIRSLMSSESEDLHSRLLAVHVICETGEYDCAEDISILISADTPDASEVASTILAVKGFEGVEDEKVATLLMRLAGTLSSSRKFRRSSPSRYYIGTMIRAMGTALAGRMADALSHEARCNCHVSKKFDCTCSAQLSKILARLVDQYLSGEPRDFDLDRFALWFGVMRFDGAPSQHTTSVSRLLSDTHLRRSLQFCIAAKETTIEGANERVNSMLSGHIHRGLQLREGDLDYLSDMAYEYELLPLWVSTLQHHKYHSSPQGRNDLRARQRSQSHGRKEFLEAWYRSEKAFRSPQWLKIVRTQRRASKRLAARQQSEERKINSKIYGNIEKVVAGQHYGFLRYFSRQYLGGVEEDDMRPIDSEIGILALRNCLPHLLPHVPSLKDVATGGYYDIRAVISAAVLAIFRSDIKLDTVDRRILEIARSDINFYRSVKDDELEAIENELDQALFPSGEGSEDYIRTYLEAELGSATIGHVHTELLEQKAFSHLKGSLPLSLLTSFPKMPLEAVRRLFEMCVSNSEIARVIDLIDIRLSDPIKISSDPEEHDNKWWTDHRSFWLMNAFLYGSRRASEAWLELSEDPSQIFALDNQIGEFRHHSDAAPKISAMQVFKIMESFIPKWPKVELPSSWGSGDPPGERAYRFLASLPWRINKDEPENRLPILDKIIGNGIFSDFRNEALSMRAQAMREIAIQGFRPPSLADLNKLLSLTGIATVEDLRAMMLEQLGGLQNWVRGSETDPLATFYDGGVHVDENTARNRIVDRLTSQMIARGLVVSIEAHMAASKRCDITVTAPISGAQKMLVMEVKGQWNGELFLAASAQLDKRYAIHPHAERQGIYLVLWYGSKVPVKGSASHLIKSAEELQAKIRDEMAQELLARVDVFVLDVSRPS